ncbi:PQQ-binding-like beta-propeller repeat protein [Flavobacterium sp. 245]|uniref:PQQ-binding-like beta-propeller repeat protein n=1 Tax=Flavobacterium sp. 245 TaxID=2512115 RepID=UPI00105F30A9|nr:PQQ-binding-like beta-propeller repeat protein [Flavobacterium sp. 245]TDO99100.1 putative pyrroloquinoline-quinone binding quinoprotein [Flavobacterium sp. 245]
MPQKLPTYYFLNYCLFFICCSVFSQTEISRSNFVFTDFKPRVEKGYLTSAGTNILFNASNDSVYSIQKKDGIVKWKMRNEEKSKACFYLHGNTFFNGQYANGVFRAAQFNLETGAKINELPFQSISKQPYFLNDVMYGTVLADGGKFMAYDLKQNKVIWEINIGYGVENQPVFFKDKIAVNAEDDNWFEVDYNGKLLNTKAKTNFFLDTIPVFVRKYKFLTHDGSEITRDFLKKNKLSNAEYKIKTSTSNTFLLSENKLLILGNNKKKILELDLETIVPSTDSYPDAYSEILQTNAENIWFYYQNHLVNYDFKNKKIARKVDLTKWNPQQIILEERTIWLLSNEDGQMYTLDFEPDEKTAIRLEYKAKMDFERHRCEVPDQEKIKLIKAAQEKYNKKTK